MSNINLQVSKSEAMEAVRLLAMKLENRTRLINLVGSSGALTVIDWNEVRDDIDTSFADLFVVLGIPDELDLEDEGVLDSDDEYDEPDYYDDEVQ